MIYVNFTEQQKKQIDVIARERDKGKTTHNNYKDMKSTDRHSVGMWGEMACRVFLDATIDYEIYGKKGDGNRPDCVVRGKNGQIKTRRGMYTDCFVPISSLKKLSNDDIVILCWKLTDDTGYIAGWLSKEDILGLNLPVITTRYPKKEDVYIIPYGKFKPF